MFRFLTRRRWLKPSEVAIFFPTAAWLHEQTDHWHVPLHGWIAEPEKRTPRRAAVIGLFRRYLKPGRDPIERALFLERARLFVASKERVRPVDVLLGEDACTLDPTGRNGHVTGYRLIAGQRMDRLAGQANGRPRWLEFRAATREGDVRHFCGAAQIIGPEGLSVISDIDDTLKISEVADQRALLRNTFLKDFRPVRGMSELLQQWEARGAAFHYVSASPWQLYVPLAEFFESHGFPRASFHMQPYRVRLLARRRRQALQQFAHMHQFKAQAISRLLELYPRRQFVLVGDSSQHDPEIYGTLARQHPRQVRQIAIRNITGESAGNARLRAAFAGIEPQRWTLFDDPHNVPV
jgi:hypothetical protein